MAVLIRNIKSLIQVDRKEKAFLAGDEMKDIPTIDNAWLLLDNERIHSYGSMEKFPETEQFDNL
ncbi:MAG: hypothetical protein C0593_12240 [Marinilabiliales bacterium]|nr:MAG: hypothetical protein C0593_12240 [Marinilabiliales bacterium]